MRDFLIAISLIVGFMLIVGLHRVWAGPTVFDRLVAVALVSANSLVILIVVGSIIDRIDAFIDIALAYALLTFTLPIAIGKYFEVGHEEEEARARARRRTEAGPPDDGDQPGEVAAR